MDLQGRLLSTRISLALAAWVVVSCPADRNLAAQETRTCASRDESLLLNLRMSWPTLDVWDPQAKEWHLGTEGTQLGVPARVRIVHLWSTTCKPCEKEFPLLKQMDLQLRSDYRGEVQFVYIADAISSGNSMRDYMDRHHQSMPIGQLYRDSDNRISAELLRALPGASVEALASAPNERLLSLPMTLLLDEDNVVRQVFVGSLLNRRGEFINALAQLNEALTQKGGSSKSQLVAKKPQVGL